jgi:hypothetical protein
MTTPSLKLLKEKHFRYRDKDGREQRCRRDASVQTATAARIEADR